MADLQSGQNTHTHTHLLLQHASAQHSLQQPLPELDSGSSDLLCLFYSGRPILVGPWVCSSLQWEVFIRQLIYTTLDAHSFIAPKLTQHHVSTVCYFCPGQRKTWKCTITPLRLQDHYWLCWPLRLTFPDSCIPAPYAHQRSTCSKSPSILHTKRRIPRSSRPSVPESLVF